MGAMLALLRVQFWEEAHMQDCGSAGGPKFCETSIWAWGGLVTSWLNTGDANPRRRL